MLPARTELPMLVDHGAKQASVHTIKAHSWPDGTRLFGARHIALRSLFARGSGSRPIFELEEERTRSGWGDGGLEHLGVPRLAGSELKCSRSAQLRKPLRFA